MTANDRIIMATLSCAATLICTSSVSTPAKVLIVNHATVEVVIERSVMIAMNTISLLRLFELIFSLVSFSAAFLKTPIADTPFFIIYRQKIQFCMHSQKHHICFVQFKCYFSQLLINF